MNLTAKITAMAMPDHVMVGNITYKGWICNYVKS
jgi:hypothetical protein